MDVNDVQQAMNKNNKRQCTVAAKKMYAMFGKKKVSAAAWKQLAILTNAAHSYVPM